MWGRLIACGVASARLPQVPASRSSGTEVPRRLKPAPQGLSLYSANLSKSLRPASLNQQADSRVDHHFSGARPDARADHLISALRIGFAVRHVADRGIGKLGDNR